MKNHLIYIAFATALCISCTKSFDDINTDPDRPRPTDVPPTNIMSYCERVFATNVYNSVDGFMTFGSYCGQVALISYPIANYYGATQDIEEIWSNGYATINNLQVIIEHPKAPTNLRAAATILQCNIFATLTDIFGNIPYNEACQIEHNFIHPRYDNQHEIYTAVLAKLKTAVETLSATGGEIGVGDILLGGDPQRWRQYGNALRLRMAARMTQAAHDEAEEVFVDVLSTPDGIPQSNADNIFFTAWGSEYAEPMAAAYLSRPGDFAISNIMIDELEALNDPRLPIYADITADYLAGASNEPYVGYTIGMAIGTSRAATSPIGERFVHKNDIAGLTPIVRSCECYFAIAYAASQGIATPGYTFQSAYETAVRLSLSENDIADNIIKDYLATSAAFNGTQEQLFTQWWIACFKNNIEAWSLFRMSGYPSSNVIAPTTTYHQNRHNTPPFAMPYPSTEAALNTQNYNREAACEQEQFWGKRMWWDKREGVH